MARGATRLRSEITGATKPGNDVHAWFETGTVATVTGGDGYGNNATITVTWRDKEVPASYVNTYFPAVGDTVLLAYQSPSVIVLGGLVGPSEEE